MAILSFFHDAFVFVITMATKQRLEVNLELGDSWQTSSWTEQYFFSSLIVQRCHFACRKINLLAIDGVCKQYTYRAPLFSCTVVAQSRCSHVVIVCSHTMIPCICMAQVTKHIVCVFAQKHALLIAQCRTPCRT